MKLTSANVTLPEGKTDHVVFDDTLKGFGLRVRRLSGDRIGKAWIIQYRQHGHGRRMIVGDAEKITSTQARKRARKLLAQVELGGDPQGDKKERRDKDSHSLRGVISEFLAHKSGKENTLRAARLYLEGDAYLGSLRSLPVDRITRRDLSSRILAVSKANGVPTALGFRAQVSALFTWALQAGLVEHNPLVGGVKPTRPEARDRVLTDQELGAIWRLSTTTNTANASDCSSAPLVAAKRSAGWPGRSLAPTAHRGPCRKSALKMASRTRCPSRR